MIPDYHNYNIDGMCEDYARGNVKTDISSVTLGFNWMNATGNEKYSNWPWYNKLYLESKETFFRGKFEFNISLGEINWSKLHLDIQLIHSKTNRGAYIAKRELGKVSAGRLWVTPHFWRLYDFDTPSNLLDKHNNLTFVWKSSTIIWYLNNIMVKRLSIMNDNDYDVIFKEPMSILIQLYRDYPLANTPDQIKFYPHVTFHSIKYYQENNRTEHKAEKQNENTDFVDGTLFLYILLPIVIIILLIIVVSVLAFILIKFRKINVNPIQANAINSKSNNYYDYELNNCHGEIEESYYHDIRQNANTYEPILPNDIDVKVMK